MGALIHMRDDPMDAPFPNKIEPDLGFHRKRLEGETTELQEVVGWDEETAEHQALSAHLVALKGYLKGRKEEKATRANYENMLAQVEAWEPPTEDHGGFKEYMADQLQKSIDFDTGYYEDPEKRPARMTGEEYRAQRIEVLSQSIGRATERLFEEVDMTAKRSAWVEALNASLDGWQPPEVVAAR